MRANRDRLLEAPLTGFVDDDRVGILRRLRGELRHVEIPFGPGANDVGDGGRVPAGGPEGDGPREGDGAFWKVCRRGDGARIVDTAALSARREEKRQYPPPSCK